LYWMCVEFLFLVESMDYRMIPSKKRVIDDVTLP